jgi:hypothetical protein
MRLVAAVTAVVVTVAAAVTAAVVVSTEAASTVVADFTLVDFTVVVSTRADFTVSTPVDFMAAAFMHITALRGSDAATARDSSKSTPPALAVRTLPTAWPRATPRKIALCKTI